MKNKKQEKLLKRNLDTLKILNKQLSELIKNADDKQGQFTIKTNEKDFTNLFIKYGNKIMSAYDLNNDEKNFTDIIEKIPKNDQGVTVLIGMGLGHLAYNLLENKEKKHCLVIVETFPFLIKEAFKLYDFTEYIKDGHIMFACPTETEVQHVLALVENFNVITEWNLICEPYVNILAQEYKNLITTATDTINQIRCNVGTVVGNGKAIAQNDIKNLPYIIRHRGVAEYKDAFKDKPAVLVSTGPSLRKNIHKLKKYQDKVVIICVAQAIRVLLAYGIRPDFACTVDYGVVNMEHFKGLMDCGIPLIILNRAYAGILKEWQGPKIISTSLILEKEQTIAGFIAQKGSMEQGGSVSHMCLGAAINFGCNPIAMIGQDLSYENGLSHNQNADASGKVEIDKNGMITWNVDDPNSILKENAHKMGGVLNIEGYFGNVVQTNVGLMSFITSFENIFKAYKDKFNFYNCTEGGAYIKYCTNLYLENFLKQFAKKKVKTDLNYSTIENEKEYIEKAIELLKEGRKNLNDVIDNCNKALKAAKMAEKHYKSKRKLNKYLSDNELYSNAAHEETKKNNLLSIAIYHASRRIYEKDLNVEGNIKHIKGNKKDFLIRIKRNKLILNTALEEAKELIELYNDAQKLLAKYLDTREEKLLISKVKEKPDIESADKYFEKGNFAYPLVEARKISKKNIATKRIIEKAESMMEEQIKKADALPDNSELLLTNAKVKEAIEIGRTALKEKDEKGLKESLKLLEGIKNKDQEVVMWGLASLHFFNKEVEKSIEYFKKLIEKCPNNYRYQFEYGNVLLNKNPEKAISYLINVMDKTEEFDHFFKTIGILYQDKEEYKNAIEAYEKYIKKFPGDFIAYKALLDCSEAIKDEERIKIYTDKMKQFQKK